MKEKLQEKAVNGVFWMAIQNFGSLLISFSANIILARLLSPNDFGCVGLLLVFTTLADVLIEGGFGTALIQKKELNKEDCSTVFVSNFILSIILYGIIFYYSPAISNYFKVDIIKNILRIEGIAIILRGFYIVQKSLLDRNLNFKKSTIIQISANIISVTGAIVAAYEGLGIWSLVIKNILLHLFLAIGYWIKSVWKINIRFSSNSFRTLFNYGIKVFLSNLIEMAVTNIQSVLIGKKFTSEKLGYYSQSKSLGQIPIYSISMIVNQVLFPTLSILQDEKEKFFSGVRKSMTTITYIAFPIISFMIIMAEPIIIMLFTEKWLPSVKFLQLICIAGLVNSIIHTNFSILKSLGRSDLFLLMEVIINGLTILSIFIGMKYGIDGLLWGYIISIYVSCFILSFIVKRLIAYGPMKQLLDVGPNMAVALLSSLLTFYLRTNLTFNNWIIIILCTILFFTTYYSISRLLHLKGYVMIKDIIIDFVKKIKNSI